MRLSLAGVACVRVSLAAWSDSVRETLTEAPPENIVQLPVAVSVRPCEEEEGCVRNSLTQATWA